MLARCNSTDFHVHAAWLYPLVGELHVDIDSYSCYYIAGCVIVLHMYDVIVCNCTRNAHACWYLQVNKITCELLCCVYSEN